MIFLYTFLLRHACNNTDERKGRFMAKLSSFLTTDNVKTILSVALKVAERFEESSSKWKNKSLPCLIISIIAVAGMMGCMIYFIVTTRIAPLMIYVAACIPILSFGLASLSKNLDRVQKEFTEYTEAMHNVLTTIKKSADCTADEATAAVAAVLASTTNTPEDELDNLTYAQIKALPQFAKASLLVQSMMNLKEAIQALKEEGNDVDDILASLDLEGYETDEFYNTESNTVYQNLTGTGEKPTKDEKSTETDDT